MIEEITLKNENTKDILTISKNPKHSYILDYADFGQATCTRNTTKYIGQDGISVSESSFDERDIEISGWIVGENENEIAYKKKKLNTFINPMRKITLNYKSYSIEFYPEKSIEYALNYAENNEVLCKFKIFGLCPYPLFKSKLIVSNAITTQPMFHFPLIIKQNEGVKFGIKSKSQTFEVENMGDVETGCIFEIHASGEVQNPYLIDLFSFEQFAINYTMAAGDKIIINTQTGQRNVKCIHSDLSEENFFKYRDLNSTWLQLREGVNTFGIGAETNVEALEVLCKFTNKYIEVQQ